jgi:hypothetical protein
MKRMRRAPARVRVAGELDRYSASMILPTVMISTSPMPPAVQPLWNRVSVKVRPSAEARILLSAQP